MKLYNSFFVLPALLCTCFIAGCTKDKGTLTDDAIAQYYDVTVDLASGNVSGSALFRQYSNDVEAYVNADEKGIKTTMNGIDGVLNNYSYYWNIPGGLQDITVVLSVKGKRISNFVSKNEFAIFEFPADMPDSLSLLSGNINLKLRSISVPNSTRVHVTVCDSTTNGYASPIAGGMWYVNGDVVASIGNMDLSRLKNGYAWVRLISERKITLENNDGDEEASMMLSTTYVKKIPLKK